MIWQSDEQNERGAVDKMAYFPPERSSYRVYHGDVADTLQLIANRYIGSQPKHPWVFRASHRGAFKRNIDYRYEFDFVEKFPEIRDGQFVYAWAKLWSDQEAELPFSVSCFGPVRVYVNGELAFKSNIQEDVFPDQRSWFRQKLQAGWNHFVLQFEKTGTGCGGHFGTGSIKGLPLHFVTASAERDGQEGWLYTEPLDERLAELPGEGTTEADDPVRWLPQAAWEEAELRRGVFGRLFADEEGEVAYAWTKLVNQRPDGAAVEIAGEHRGALTVYLNGKEVYRSASDSGNYRITVPCGYGVHDLLVRSERPADDAKWDHELRMISSGTALQAPVLVHGFAADWLYTGAFRKGSEPAAADLCRLDTVFEAAKGGTYWRVDQPNTVLRPFVETTHYGRWNYPLGVTLYGLLRTGLKLGRQDYVDYVLDHIEQCTAYEQYALWDKEQYGGAGINHQLTAIDSLDDCGSFAATMLYAMEQRELKGARKVADRIAHYISHEQSRLEDGALYRVTGSTLFMKDTMWCDDLYMSTPFLARYYELTGDRAYVDDAAKQFLLYKKYLYMPELKIMSHVYDFKFDKQNKVPWGRGNGWVLFSLTELLRVLPEDHEDRDELLTFFRELSEGYLALQGENGLWHQVLTMPESYEEASCTSMFIYAFARGVRYGWLTNPEPYVEAVERGWEGLARYAIDGEGNIYGVCRGSGYAFSALYYKDDLPWNLNDTHGIGIVMLAGIETWLLREALRNRNSEHGERTDL